MTAIPLLITLEGADAPAVHSVPADRKLADIRGQLLPDAADARAYRPDAEEPLGDELTVAELGLEAGAEITIARTKKIDLTVFYGGLEHTESWAPNQRLRLVLKWALSDKAFDVPKADQPNFELAFDDTDATADLDATVATLVGPTGVAAGLHLRRIVAPQG